MKNLIKAVVIAGVLSTGSLAAAPAANAYPHNRTSVYLDFGNVGVGYRDGYYDHSRRWHRWERNRDREYWRHHYRGNYYDRYDYHRYHRW